MKTFSSARCAFALLATATVGVFASIADAQQAYVYTRTSLRAGPDRGYPQVAWLGGGTSVYVNGCVRGYHWCDVTAGGVRGWANARHLQYYYQNRRVALYGNGALYGFPVVGFTVGSYWDNHYRDRPWYSHRSHWHGWRPGTPTPRYDAYNNYNGHVARPHVHQSQVVAPRPHVSREFAPQRPYVREAAPQQFHQPSRQYQQSAPVQQHRPQPRERAVVQERGTGSFPVNGSLR